jgi:PhoH-like ATPase
MPLPPAPTKRAALLNTEALDAPVKSRATRHASERATPAERHSAPVQVETIDRTSSRTTEKEVLRQEVTEPATARSAARKTTPTRTTAAPKKPKHTGPAKLFVLDTNVLMHDPMCLFRFEEHDVFLPMIVLEELDGHKKGMTEVARNARQTSRSLDALVASHNADIITGIKLDGTGHKEVGGRLFFQTEPLDFTLPSSLPQGKADNQILGVVEALRVKHAPREVVLVSKDINMRVKARALGLAAEDYQNDKTLEDGDLLYSGALALPEDFWIKHAKSVESWQSGSQTFYRLTGPLVPDLHINQFVYARDRNSRQDRGTENAQRFHPFEECRLGRDHAQP